MLTVWGRATSSNVQCVMWATAELGLDVTRIDCGGSFGGLDTPDFRAMNPNGRIPVLQDGDVTVFESGAILRHLARQYGDASFWPRDVAGLAKVDQWAEWAKLNVADKFVGPIFWRVVRTPPERHDHTAIAEAVARLDASLRVAEQQLARHAFLAGDDLTPADIHLGHMLYRYFDIDIDRPDLPALRAYYDRLARRAAYRDHVMISYESLRNTI